MCSNNNKGVYFSDQIYIIEVEVDNNSLLTGLTRIIYGDYWICPRLSPCDVDLIAFV